MSIVVDVAIGVVFLYLLLALLVTTVQEFLASVLRMRSTNLYNAIEGMLKGSVAGAGGAPGAPASTKLITALLASAD
jgi:hypothetical protein